MEGGMMFRALQRTAGAERNLQPGEVLDRIQIVRVKRGAEVGDCTKLGGIFRVLCGEHAGSGPGGFGHGVPAFEHCDAQASASEFECGGETNDSASGDDYICCAHSSIVWRAIDKKCLSASIKLGSLSARNRRRERER